MKKTKQADIALVCFMQYGTGLDQVTFMIDGKEYDYTVDRTTCDRIRTLAVYNPGKALALAKERHQETPQETLKEKKPIQMPLPFP